MRLKEGGLMYKKIRAANLKKWCAYVYGKNWGGGGGGGGVELHIGLEI